MSPIAASSAPPVQVQVPSVASSAASSNSASNSIAIGSSEYTSDTQSSSECFSTTAEFDIFPLASPTSVNSNILSPSCDASRGSWHTTKGDTTPHGNRKSSSHNRQHSENSGSTNNNSNSKSQVPASLSCCVTPSSELRTCPLPRFSWADSNQVWKLMCRKDEKASLEREPNMFDQHPGRTHFF